MRIISRPIIFVAVFIGILTLLFSIIGNNQNLAKADTNHVVISQVQIEGASATDEFVELYNPTDASIDLAGWRLSRKTATVSATPQNLVTNLSGTIAPKGYFLIVNPNSPASPSADKLYSTGNSIAADNTVLLYSDAGFTVVDKVGFGAAGDNETASFTLNPDNNQSILRKATETSTAQSLSLGGAEATHGNGHDTDNNSTDFVLLTTSMPRNTDSPAANPPVSSPITPTEPVSSPITPTDEPTPTVTLTPTPTEIPTPTPTDTPTPTEIPTPTNTPTPTLEPTVTSTPTPTLTPTPTPGSEIIVDEQITPKLRLICTQKYRSLNIFGLHLSIPYAICSIQRI